MKSLFSLFGKILALAGKVRPRARALLFFLVSGIRFRKLGRLSKVLGHDALQVGAGVSVGDFCWIEAVQSYAGERFQPRLKIGAGVAISDLTHISCLKHINIGDDCLLGSKIYIGDHSHGSVSDLREIQEVPPAKRPLRDADDIVIGPMTWVCDGAVILAGSHIAANSIVAANSVVRLKVDRPALIAGAPARVIRYLDGKTE